MIPFIITSLCDDTSQYWQIYQYMPICAIHTSFPIHTNTSGYVQINAIHAIHTNAYQYTSVLSNACQYRHLQTNTYQYIQYISLLTNTSNTDQNISYIPIHTNTSNTGQYRLIYTNTYQYVQYKPFFHTCQY